MILVDSDVFGDVLVFAMLEVRKGEVTTFVTWNARHFRGRAEVDVREPPAAP